MITQLNNLSEIWSSWMWAMAWQTVVLVSIVWFLDLLLRRWIWPQVRYALWLLVLIKLLIPPGFSSPTSVTGPLADLPQRVQIRLSPPSPKPSVASLLPITESATPAAQSPQLIAGKEDNASYSPLPQPDSSVPLNPKSLTANPPLPLDSSTQTITAEEIQTPPGQTVIWKFYLMLGWLLGMWILAGWLFVKLRHLSRTVRTGDPSAQPQWFDELLLQCAKRLKLKKLPNVIFTRAIRSPAVYGIFHPVLLMPADRARSLSRQDAEHILLHELAHIKRGDLAVHAVFIVLQIIYWFHPLLWVVRRQLQHLRELCCDATVARLLREKTSSYRETLLETARALLAEKTEPGMGLLGLFEDANRLRIRLSWLEKKTWKHRPLQIAAVLAVVGVMLVCVLPMAAVPAPSFVIKGLVTDAQTGLPIAGAKVGDIQEYNDGKFCTITDSKGYYEYKTWYEEHGTIAEANSYKSQRKDFNTKIFGSEKEKVINFVMEREAATGPYIARLPNGVTVELVGVCEHPSEGKQWWRPDGTGLETVPYDRVNASISGQEGRQVCEAAVVVEGAADTPGFRCSIPVARQTHSSDVFKADKQIRGMYGIAFDAPQQSKDAEIRIGIASGEWNTVWTTKADFQGTKAEGGDQGGVVWSQPEEIGGKTILSVAHGYTDKNVRINAIGKDGTVYVSGSTSSSVHGFEGIRAEFEIALSQIKEFQYQTRPYEWVMFKKVSLRPGEKTTVVMETEKGRAAAGQRENIEKSVEKDGRYIATLPSGVTVELQAVCEDPGKGMQWWKPDGDRAENGMFQLPHVDVQPPAGCRRYGFVAAVHGAKEPSIYWQISQGQETRFLRNVKDRSGNPADGAKGFVAALRENETTTNLKVGVSSKEWETIAKVKANSAVDMGFYGNAEYTIDQPAADPEDPSGRTTLVKMSHTFYLNEYALRMVALTKSGETVVSMVNFSGGAKLIRVDHRWHQLPLEQIKEIQFQIRPYEWVTFKNVSLRPGEQTNVQVEVENKGQAAGQREKIEKSAKNTDGRYITRLPNGVTVELLGFSQLIENGLAWWSLGGKQIKIPGVNAADLEGFGSVIALRINPKEDVTINPHYRRGLEEDPFHTWWQLPGDDIWLLAMGKERRYINLKVYTICAQPWITHKTIPLTTNDMERELEIDSFRVHISNRGVLQDPPVTFEIAVDYHKVFEFKADVLDQRGAKHELIQKLKNNNTCVFIGKLPLEQVTGIVLQSREFRSDEVEFRNLTLLPGQKSDVQIEIKKTAVQVESKEENAEAGQAAGEKDWRARWEAKAKGCYERLGEAYRAQDWESVKAKAEQLGQAMAEYRAAAAEKYQEIKPQVEQKLAELGVLSDQLAAALGEKKKEVIDPAYKKLVQKWEELKGEIGGESAGETPATEKEETEQGTLLEQRPESGEKMQSVSDEISRVEGGVFSATAERTVKYNQVAGAEAGLIVQTDNGGITVAGQDRPACDITAVIEGKAGTGKRAEELARQVEIHVENSSGLRIYAKEPKCARGESVTVNFEIQGLRVMNMDLRSDNGAILIANVEGTSRAVTDNGRIEAKGLQGKGEFVTDNGRIEIMDCTMSSLAARTDNGAIEIRDSSFTKAEARTDNSTIRANGIKGAIDFASDNGRIEVKCAEGADPVCNAVIATSTGAIDFTPPAQVSARVEVRTETGVIRTDRALEVKGMVGKTAQGTLGAGAGVIRLSSETGAITIH